MLDSSHDAALKERFRGKTAVLTERVLTLITDPERPVDIDRLLIVTFSNAARGVDQNRATADFDAGKVKAVKASIEKGTFTVDAEAIADKLLSNAQETLARSRG